MNKMRKCIIWGAGKGGRQLLEQVQWLGYDVVAYCDMNPQLHGSKVENVPVIGKEEAVQLVCEDVTIEIIVGVLDGEKAEEIRKIVKNEFPKNIVIRNGVSLSARHLAPILVPVEIRHILAGKVALITGGGSGIGYAIAELFLKAGCKCIIAGRDRDKLLRAKESLCECEDRDGIQIAVMDVLNVCELADAVEEAAHLFSENRIDILINNAGAFTRKRIIVFNEDEYDMVMDTNVKGTVFMTQAMGRYMIEKRIRGHIVNICSSTAFAPAYTPYQISKWAIRGFTLGAAKELAPYGITVNGVAPGSVALTGMGRIKVEGESIHRGDLPSGRDTVPEEVAVAVLYLASGFADQSVGEIFSLTGGDGNLVAR